MAGPRRGMRAEPQEGPREQGRERAARGAADPCRGRPAAPPTSSKRGTLDPSQTLAGSSNGSCPPVSSSGTIAPRSERPQAKRPRPRWLKKRASRHIHKNGDAPRTILKDDAAQRKGEPLWVLHCGRTLIIWAECAHPSLSLWPLTWRTPWRVPCSPMDAPHRSRRAVPAAAPMQGPRRPASSAATLPRQDT